MSAVLLAAGLLAAGLMAACSTIEPAREAAPPAAAPDAPIDLGGRFAVNVIDSVPEPRTESVAGSFRLHRDDTRTTLELSSPLGQMRARAEQRRGEPATLETADQRVFRAATLDDVLQQATGMRLPAARLPDWLQDRFEKVLERGPDGRPVRAQDSGWLIDRRGARWNLLWHEGSRRIESRLVLDPR